MKIEDVLLITLESGMAMRKKDILIQSKVGRNVLGGYLRSMCRKGLISRLGYGEYKIEESGKKRADFVKEKYTIEELSPKERQKQRKVQLTT
ncbi:MAG TPA: hypothetical protein VJH97_01775, partial [Candidatus Nanoarchaeia archaeon]|nr:hypothetical protein [Candidatus Nanoarchaeia archaeon]